MRFSIITVALNSAETIEDTIKSVLGQTYPDIEYIVIDGGSTDGTLEIIREYERSDGERPGADAFPAENDRAELEGGEKMRRISRVVSERDGGMYEAMNKGISLATGDVIGILNADDIYASSDTIRTVADRFADASSSGPRCVWGDLVYVDRNDLNKVVRNWKSSPYGEGSFRKGWHPPHPTFFVRKEVYEEFGEFRTDLGTASDYELMLRLLEKHKIASIYIPQILVKMRDGGRSNKSLLNLFRANLECYKAFKLNDLKVDPLFIIRKPLSKRGQFRKQ